jgi:predicted dithiol-disulfide oxidoreductase (DUF899 family)
MSKRKAEEVETTEKKQKVESDCCAGIEKSKTESGAYTYPKKEADFHSKKSDLKDSKVVSHEEWVEARKTLLQEEKNLSRHIDYVTKLRQQLPWEKVSTDYTFDGVNGEVKLSSLFDKEKGVRDLVIYHAMFGPKDDNCCPVCVSFLDGWTGYLPHLQHHRKIAFAAVARASIDKINAVKARNGWKFTVLSSGKSTFNVDYKVACPESTSTEENKTSSSLQYNYGGGWPHAAQNPHAEFPGLSVFHLGLDGGIYHTYSCYARGLDILHAGNQLLDLLPHGRNGFVALEHLTK